LSCAKGQRDSGQRTAPKRDTNFEAGKMARRKGSGRGSKYIFLLIIQIKREFENMPAKFREIASSQGF